MFVCSDTIKSLAKCGRQGLRAASPGQRSIGPTFRPGCPHHHHRRKLAGLQRGSAEPRRSPLGPSREEGEGSRAGVEGRESQLPCLHWRRVLYCGPSTLRKYTAANKSRVAASWRPSGAEGVAWPSTVLFVPFPPGRLTSFGGVGGQLWAGSRGALAAGQLQLRGPSDGPEPGRDERAATRRRDVVGRRPRQDESGALSGPNSGHISTYPLQSGQIILESHA